MTFLTIVTQLPVVTIAYKSQHIFSCRAHLNVLWVDVQCSFHKGDGFFPGTGDEDDIGEQLGRGFSINVPLKVCCALRMLAAFQLYTSKPL